MKVISKKKDKITLEVIGGNVESVTGSSTLISFNEKNLLFEFGTIQEGKTIKENYDLNKKMLSKVKPKNIDYIFIGHCHADHASSIPALYKSSCNALIIAPKDSNKILKEMWLDSAYINQRDVEYLNQKYDKFYEPFFTEDEVNIALNHIVEYPFHEIISIDDELSFRFIPSGHILLSAQTELFIKNQNHVKKITFTSDLGNIKLTSSKVFIENFEPIVKSNIIIGEATYSAKNRSMTQKDFKTDLEKIKTVINQFCVENNRLVVIPCFALDRMPYMLWLLYLLFGNDKNFSIPIIVDSPLAIRLLNVYSEVLQGEAKEKFDAMMAWQNIKLSYTPEESKALMSDGKPKCVLSSSGMLQAGRSVKWVQLALPNPNDCILFIGFATTNTLAYKIKHEKEQRTITINGQEIPNKCQIVDLHSFSSHMQRDNLLNYYSNIITDKIYLVHGNMEDKIEFKKDLEECISKKLNSTKVIAVNKSTKISL